MDQLGFFVLTRSGRDASAICCRNEELTNLILFFVVNIHMINQTLSISSTGMAKAGGGARGRTPLPRSLARAAVAPRITNCTSRF